MSGAIVVDYEELRRMAKVWAAAAESLARQSASVAALAFDPAIAAQAMFDPLGAARAEASIAAAAAPPHGLAALSVRLAADGVALEAVVFKEQAVDDFPVHQLAAFDRWLVTAPLRLPFDPKGTASAGWHDLTSLGDAMLGYLAPFTEPLLATLAPSPVFRADVLEKRPVEVDPVFGLPLSLIEDVEPEGPGYISVSKYTPTWGGTAPGSLGATLTRVADLEGWPDASLAVEQVRGRDGVTRYIIELPGMRHMGASPDPQDLTGAISAMVSPSTAYTRCVAKALDAVGAPRGAPVLLVGHSEGGIVAMDLAGDAAFNGGRAHVVGVVAAGSPISSKTVAPASGTKVLSVENVNDIVPHLDAVDASPERPDRMTYQFSDDEHDVGASHSAWLYARRLAGLADSPNPLMRGFEGSVAPFLDGTTTTTVFTLADAPPR